MMLLNKSRLFSPKQVYTSILNRLLPQNNSTLYQNSLYFYHSNATINQGPSLAQNQLRLSDQWDFFQDFEQKYKLSQVQDIKKIYSVLNHHDHHRSINELAYFLTRIVELMENSSLKSTMKDSEELTQLINKIKHDLKEPSHENALIGAYAWCFWKLDYHKDPELWLTLGDYIVDERFHPTFEEAVNGIEGFNALQGFADDNYFEEVYKKFERICFFNMKEIDVDNFKRISGGFAKVNKRAEVVFQKIEDLILKSPEKEYDSSDLLEIASAFAFSGNGSTKFYALIEELVFKNIKKNKICNLDSFIAKLLQTYSLASIQHPTLEINPDFKELIRGCLLDESIIYDLSEIVSIKKNIEWLNLENEEAIQELLDKKLFLVKGEMDPDDMIRYIDILVERKYNENYKLLPSKVTEFFDQYLNKNLAQQTPQKIYYYISESDKRGLFSTKKELINSLITYVLSRLRDHNADQLSYYYTLFDEYYMLIDQSQINQALAALKDFIRLICYSRGFG
jgi:hypothetical protein